MKFHPPITLQKIFSLRWFKRSRWNILDLIQILERGSVPTCLFAEVDMTWAENMRETLSRRGIKTTVTAFLLKAIGIAQRSHPDSRAVLLPWGQTMIVHRIVAGFTVEKHIDGEPAVYLGTIEAPDIKSLAEISQELQIYAEKDVTEIPQLALQERFNHMPWLWRRLIIFLGLTIPSVRFHYMPASFGLTSLGKYGIKGVVPPCVSTSTFGVGTVEQKAVRARR